MKMLSFSAATTLYRVLNAGALMGSRTEHSSRMFHHFSQRVENNILFSSSHNLSILLLLRGNERHGGHNGQLSKRFQV